MCTIVVLNAKFPEFEIESDRNSLTIYFNLLRRVNKITLIKKLFS